MYKADPVSELASQTRLFGIRMLSCSPLCPCLFDGHGLSHIPAAIAIAVHNYQEVVIAVSYCSYAAISGTRSYMQLYVIAPVFICYYSRHSKPNW